MRPRRGAVGEASARGRLAPRSMRPHPGGVGTFVAAAARQGLACAWPGRPGTGSARDDGRRAGARPDPRYPPGMRRVARAVPGSACAACPRQGEPPAARLIPARPPTIEHRHPPVDEPPPARRLPVGERDCGAVSVAGGLFGPWAPSLPRGGGRPRRGHSRRGAPDGPPLVLHPVPPPASRRTARALAPSWRTVLPFGRVPPSIPREDRTPPMRA